MPHVNWSQALSSQFPPGLRNKYIDLARRHGKTRASALRYLLSIGGYYNHGQRWALSWKVKMHGSMDFDDLYAVQDAGRRPEFTALCKNDAERGLLYNYMKSVYDKHQNDWFNWATEDAWMQFQECDHTFWGGTRDSEFSLAGRSAGHLVMVRCGKINTAKATPDLMYELSERDPVDRGRYVVGHDEVVHLFLIAVQTSIDCAPQAINEDIMHVAAFALWERAGETEFKDLQNVYRYQRASTLQDAFNGDSACANDVRAMLGLPQEKTE